MGTVDRQLGTDRWGASRRLALAVLLLLVPLAPRLGGSAALARQVAPAAANPPIELATHTVRLANGPSRMVVDDQTARVFVATSAGVTVLDAPSGSILVELVAPAAKRPPGFAPSIALDARRARVFVGRGTTLTVLDAASGRTLRTLALAQAADWLVVDAAHDRVLDFDCGAASRVAVLDETSGAMLRTAAGATGGCRSQPMLDAADGRVFLLTTTGLAVFDAATGVLRRTIPIEGPTDMLVTANPSRVFILSGVGGYTPVLTTLDARSLRVLRRVSYGPFDRGVSFGNFLGIDEARHRVFAYLLSLVGLQVLDTATGRVVPTAAQPVPGATAGATDPGTGYLYAVCLYDIDGQGQPRENNGLLTVLDIAHGWMLASATIGYFPSEVVVSPRVGRVFVLVAAPATGVGQIDDLHGELDIVGLLPAQR